jgi:hypothetical protein
MNDIEKRFHGLVSSFLAGEPEIKEQIIDEKIAELRCLPTFSNLSDVEVENVRAEIKSEFSIKLDQGSLIQEKGHEKWFLDKKPLLDMKYWERYKKYLLNDKGFSVKVVNTMDDILDKLTDLLGDPSRDVAYSRRGLIIGDVQSGKTANYLGLICKAVDVGYKVVVLMTGTIEKLRKQTQMRVDEGFVGADSDAMMKMLENGQIIGVGNYDSSIRPMVLTSTADDFKQQNANNLGFDLRNINGPVIFVVKKNSSILKRLNKWLTTFNQNGQQKIRQSILVIDDEADNASVNTNKDEDSPTAINGQIRDLVSKFEKSSYVGFTATPFANIFIDPDSYDAMLEEDLFPKDYIYSLNAPSNYTGARNIFAEDGDASYMLVEIDDNFRNPQSIEFILPLKHKSLIQVRELPEDLKTAIESFVLANVMEDLAGLSNKHRSMLINVSRFTAVQEEVSGLVNEYLKDIQGACKLYCKLPSNKALQDTYMKRLKKTFETIYLNVHFAWEEVQTQLYNSCGSIIVQTINQRNGQNLNYDDYPNGLRLIAVGGMSLSRGLTLEGLVISYFYRNSRMYDTLMQMGRWFGYRGKYARFCRIWMSDDSIEWYRYISQATDELREEVKRFEDSGLTPKDFGLRVRSDLTALIVTARNKMRSTEEMECAISFSGVYIDTPEIYADLDKNRRNLESVNSLIKTCMEYGDEYTPKAEEGNQYIIRSVPVQVILEFLNEIEVSPKNEKFNTTAVRRFIREYRGEELKNWDIAFASGKSEREILLYNSTKYHCVSRSFSIENDGKILKMSGSKKHLAGGGDAAAALSKEKVREIKENSQKSNLAPNDYFTGVDRNPLLTIFAVELNECRKSESAEQEKKIQEQYLKDYVIGFGIGIPSLSDQETKYVKYVLNKVAKQQIFEDELDFEEDDD